MFTRMQSFLFFILIFMSGALVGHNNPYYGKTLFQLKQQDTSLREVIDQALSEVKWYKRIYYQMISKPTHELQAKSKHTTSVLNTTIQEIENCITQAQQELALLKKREVGIRDNNNIALTVVANIIMAPWMLLASIVTAQDIKKKENEIKIMRETQQELQTLVDNLSKISNR